MWYCSRCSWQFSQHLMCRRGESLMTIYLSTPILDAVHVLVLTIKDWGLIKHKQFPQMWQKQIESFLPTWLPADLQRCLFESDTRSLGNKQRNGGNAMSVDLIFLLYWCWGSRTPMNSLWRRFRTDCMRSCTPPTTAISETNSSKSCI